VSYRLADRSGIERGADWAVEAVIAGLDPLDDVIAAQSASDWLATVPASTRNGWSSAR
jgi:hypothetical protein